MSDCKIYKLEIARLRAKIRRLEQKIKDGQTEAAGIIHQADKIMSEHQPRGKWGYAQGSRRAAEAVYNRLK